MVLDYMIMIPVGSPVDFVWPTDGAVSTQAQ